MKQSIMILSGMTYDFCSEVVFNKAIGFFDEENKIFTGIQITEEECEICSLETIKSYLQSADEKTSLRFLCGVMREEFEYYALDFHSQQISFGKAQMKDQKYVGSVKILQEKSTLVLQDTLYTVFRQMGYEPDEELRQLLIHVLETRKWDFTWNGVQYAVERKAKDRNPNIKTLMGVIPSNR